MVPSLFERVDDPLYPLEALREALANAFCHRDYQLAGGAVTLAIFDDRLEITSTGTLPAGVTLADLGRPHSSHPRNPSIAYVLYRRGLIEQWGRGTLKIRELVERAGLPSPEFEERAGELVVRFLPTRYVAPRRVDHPPTELQRSVLEALGQLGPARLGQIHSVVGLGTSQRSIRSALEVLGLFSWWRFPAMLGGRGGALSIAEEMNSGPI